MAHIIVYAEGMGSIPIMTTTRLSLFHYVFALNLNTGYGRSRHMSMSSLVQLQFTLNKSLAQASCPDILTLNS
jgi:hypothetical protein